MLRIVYMGTPQFAVPALEAIHRFNPIVAVYTQPDKPVGRGLEVQMPPVKKKALELGLPILQPERISMTGEFEKLEKFQPDIIVVVGYGQILKSNILELPRLGCINIHASLLPRWRGAAPIQWAILSGDATTGVTTMHLVEKLDAGDILLQAKTPILPEDTSQSLHDRLAKIGAELIIPTLQGLDSGQLQAIRQDEKSVTYASKLTKEMEILSPHEPAVTLERRIRALNPWPGTSVVLESKERLKIKAAKLRSNIQGNIGLIFERAGMILLGTPQGALELLNLQWEGKKTLEPAAFLNGLRGRGQSLPLKISSSS